MPVPVPVQSFITGSKYPNASSWDWLSPPLNAEDNHILRPHHLAGVYTTPLHLNDGEYHQHLLHFIDHWARFCNIGLTPSSPHLKEIILTYLLLLLHVLFQGLSLISFCCREEGGSPPTYTTLHYHLCPLNTYVLHCTWFLLGLSLISTSTTCRRSRVIAASSSSSSTSVSFNILNVFKAFYLKYFQLNKKFCFSLPFFCKIPGARGGVTHSKITLKGAAIFAMPGLIISMPLCIYTGLFVDDSDHI